MHPYSKRPPPAEPLPLGTGDFEAVSYPSIPPPPRAPVFARSMPPQPQQAYGFGQQNRYPAHYSQAPAAPHSLSPMAMSSVRNANGTGPQRVQPTVVIRSRPSVKMGISILVAGTLLGAVFGIGMLVRQNAADAAFTAEQQEQEDQHAALATPPPQAPIAPVVINSTAGPVMLPQAPAAPPPNAYAGVPFGSLVVPPAPQAAPARAPAAAAPAVAAAPPKAPQKHVWWGKPAGGAHPSLSAKVSSPAKAEPKDKDKDDGYKVASAGNDEPAPKAKPAKEPAAAKEAKDEPKETKKAERPAKSTKSGGDEADKVLKAAMGATENTL